MSLGGSSPASLFTSLVGVECVKLNDPRNLRDGDHLVVDGVNSPVWHHGIFSDGKVYHFSGEDKKDAIIAFDPFMTFISKREVTFVICYPENRCRATKDVVATAKEIFMTKNWPDYSLIWNNCEHFATFCKTGMKYSLQLWEEVGRIIAAAVSGYVSSGSAGMVTGSLGASVSLGFKPAPLSDGYAKKK